MNQLERFLVGISNVVYEGRNNIFKTFCENLDGVDTSVTWQKAIDETVNSLKKEDKEVLKMLGKMLGKTDKLGQINEINIVSRFLDKQIEDSEEEKKKNEKLYKTLGVVCGLTLAIVLV